jgi:hypothetical protein
VCFGGSFLCLYRIANPGFRNGSALHNVINHQNELVIMIAVQNFNVDAGASHPAGYFPELTRFGLVQSLDQYFMFCNHSNAGFFKRSSGSRAILEKKVSDSLAIDDEGTSTFDAYARTSQGVTHFGQSARSILKRDSQVNHDYFFLVCPAHFSLSCVPICESLNKLKLRSSAATPWSAVARHRFGRAAAYCAFGELNIRWSKRVVRLCGGQRRQVAETKAVPGHRTPRSCRT